jgi:hypothetical protein
MRIAARRGVDVNRTSIWRLLPAAQGRVGYRHDFIGVR